MEGNFDSGPSSSFPERRPASRSPSPGIDRRFSITPESVGMDQPQRPIYNRLKHAMPSDDSFPEREPDIVTNMHVDIRDRYGEWRTNVREPEGFERQNRRVRINPAPQVSSIECNRIPAATTVREVNARCNRGNRDSFLDILASAFLSGLEYTLTCFMPRIYSSMSNLNTSKKQTQLTKNPCCMQRADNIRTNVMPMGEIPTEYYEKQLEKYWNCDMFVSDSAKIIEQLNQMFLTRLRDVDVKGKGNRDLKLITYQEWVDILLKSNILLLINMEELESDICERLECLSHLMNTDQRDNESDELLKSRRDINSLIKIIQNAYRNEKWDFEGVSFETISLQDVLGADKPNIQNRPHELGATDLRYDIKTLATEVAEKHDEIQALRKKFALLEEEVQKTRENVRLKEEIVKALCNEFNCANNKVSINQSNTPHKDDCSTHCDAVRPGASEEEEEILKLLKTELNEFFEMNKEYNKQSLEMHRRMFEFMIEKSECDKLEAFRLLDCIRCKFVDLASSVSIVEMFYDHSIYKRVERRHHELKYDNVS
uniref:Uncharacterized protein n=1 Tax=Glossina palpalis gambiensis TaxID=67801 RepID=A0A1B0BNN6_9MUSC